MKLSQQQYSDERSGCERERERSRKNQLFVRGRRARHPNNVVEFAGRRQMQTFGEIMSDLGKQKRGPATRKATNEHFRLTQVRQTTKSETLKNSTFHELEPIQKTDTHTDLTDKVGFANACFAVDRGQAQFGFVHVREQTVHFHLKIGAQKTTSTHNSNVSKIQTSTPKQ
jgi:hypothetical protein